MVAAAVAPDYALSSHVAALGLTFSNGSVLPADYADGAFIGEHGSWNRDHFNGYKVVYVPFEDGTPAGMAQDVMTGPSGPASTAPARFWWPTTRATRSGASPLPTAR